MTTKVMIGTQKEAFNNYLHKNKARTADMVMIK